MTHRDRVRIPFQDLRLSLKQINALLRLSWRPNGHGEIHETRPGAFHHITACRLRDMGLAVILVRDKWDRFLCITERGRQALEACLPLITPKPEENPQ